MLDCVLALPSVSIYGRVTSEDTMLCNLIDLADCLVVVYLKQKKGRVFVLVGKWLDKGRGIARGLAKGSWACSYCHLTLTTTYSLYIQ